MAISTSAGRPYGEVPGRDFLDIDVTAAGHVATLSIRWGSNQGSYEQVHGEAEYTRQANTLADAIEAVRDVALADHTGKDGAETRGLIEKACWDALREADAAQAST